MYISFSRVVTVFNLTIYIFSDLNLNWRQFSVAESPTFLNFRKLAVAAIDCSQNKFVSTTWVLVVFLCNFLLDCFFSFDRLMFRPEKQDKLIKLRAIKSMFFSLTFGFASSAIRSTKFRVYSSRLSQR